MRCIKCHTENNLKDRRSKIGKCKECRHEFAFDPKSMSGVNFTDKFFQQTIDQVSVNNSLHFTERQFYYFFNQRQNKKRENSLKWFAGCAVPVSVAIAFVATAFLGFSAFWWLPLAFILPLAIAVLLSASLRRHISGNWIQQLRTTPSQVAGWYRRWTRINEGSAKLLQPVSRSERKKISSVSPELKKYSFDRAVICERAEIAQFLIANKFHFENNAAVLSIDGYPDDIFETVMEMLGRNPTLSVYVVHDASVEGVEMIPRLREERRWFAGKAVKIYDLGLLPRQVMKRSAFVENRRHEVGRGVSEKAAAMLQPEEVSWLNAGKYVALESVPPRVLLRVITNGIAKSRDPKSADALVPFETDGGADAGFFYIYSYDSFG